MSAVRKWGGDGLFEAVGGWDNDLARDPPPRVSRSGRVLCAPSFAIYIISSLIVTNPVSVTWAGSIRHRSSEAAGWLWVGLGHVRRAAACPVWLPESAERSRAGGGYAISLVVLAATHPTVLVFAVCACCVAVSTGLKAAAGANRL